jgi:iron complex transport system substrate-binding protein
MRIVSLLPSATEIVAALGLLDQLVGVSHECDFPPQVNALPRVLRCPIHNAGLSSAEIDRHVRQSIASGRSLYQIDVPLLTSLEPDLILSQMLCDVCAIGYGTVAGVAQTLPKRPVLLNLEPRCLDDLFGNIRLVAEHALTEATPTPNPSVKGGESTPHTNPLLGQEREPESQAEALIAALRTRVANVAEVIGKQQCRPRVLFVEWIDPLFCPGHWTPEIIELAGGLCVAGKPGSPSVRLDWEEAVAAQPDVIVITCCGYGIERTLEDLPILMGRPGWDELPAVRAGEVYVIDGSHYFNRPGPRLIDSLEMLAATLHPDALADYPIAGYVLRLLSDAT